MRRGPAVLGAALMTLTAGCGSSSLDSWTGAESMTRALAGTHPPSSLALAAKTVPLPADAGVQLTVPAAYRVSVDGQVSEGSKVISFTVGGWVLVTAPYDDTGASQNDVNLVDIGVKTDTSPIVGVSGALWFGTNTSIMADLDLPVIVTAADVDIVTERVDGDVVYADVITSLAPINTLNTYDVDSGQAVAQVNNVLTGTVSLRFNADGSAITGRVDLGGTSGQGGPTVSSEYHAALSGTRYES